jgi:hypothetical protein
MFRFGAPAQRMLILFDAPRAQRVMPDPRMDSR